MLPVELQTEEILIASEQWRKAVVKIHYMSIIESYRNHSGDAWLINSAIRQLMLDGIYEYPATGNIIAKLRKRWSEVKEDFNTVKSKNHINLIRVNDCLLATCFINAIDQMGIIKNAALYFGSDMIVLSDLYIMDASPVKKYQRSTMDIAGYWHRDSMGRSLKIFIPLEVELGGIQTQVIRHSNVTSPIPQRWEMLRASNNAKLDDMLKLTKRINSHCSHRIYNSSSNIDSCFVFDTNSFHRGRYMEEESEIGARRIHIQGTISYQQTLSLYSQLQGHGIKDLPHKLSISLKDISAIAAQKLSPKQFVLV